MCIFANIIVRKSVKGEEGWGKREGGKKERIRKERVGDSKQSDKPIIF